MHNYIAGFILKAPYHYQLSYSVTIQASGLKNN